jgi:hypothetical protein
MVWGRREYRILIVGLDGAGKTTILYRLQVRIGCATLYAFMYLFIFKICVLAHLYIFRLVIILQLFQVNFN